MLNLLRSLFSRHCDFYKAVTEERSGVKGVASETRSGDDQNREPECATIRYYTSIKVVAIEHVLSSYRPYSLATDSETVVPSMGRSPTL